MTAYHDVLIIVDEIHRMKNRYSRLPFLPKFLKVVRPIMIGLTTLNPYQSINMEIESLSFI